MSQIRDLTGLGQQSVQRGIEQALEHGFIEREPAGQQFFYSLKLVTPRDQSHHVTSHTTLLEPVTPRDQKLVTPRDTQKKEKEKKENNTAHARLMAFHDSHLVGGIPDGGAQAAAVKWLLQRYTPEQCETEYEALRSQDWRTTPVTWLTVKKNIGNNLGKELQPKLNGNSPNSEKIIADFGDWYTVEGADGSPSKRFRTPEAFARETGRNVEEVKAKWN